MGVVFKWQIGKYVSLDSKQKKYLSENFKEFHQWHRQTQLPIYAEYIDTLITHLTTEKIDGQWIHGETDKLQIFIDASVKRLKPTLATLMSTLSDEQVEEVLDNLAKERKKYKKKYVDISEKKQRRKRREELVDYISPFFGSFTEQQKQWLEEWLDQLQTHEPLTLKQQELWAKKVEDAMMHRNNIELINSKLDGIIIYRTDDWAPELQRILDHNQEATYSLLAKLVNNQTEKQKKKMLSKLKNYQKDFISLHED